MVRDILRTRIPGGVALIAFTISGGLSQKLSFYGFIPLIHPGSHKLGKSRKALPVLF